MLKTIHNLGSSVGCFSQIWKKPQNNLSGLSFGAISFNTLQYHGSMERRSRRAFPITTETADSAALPAFSSRRARFFRITQVRATESESNSDASSSSSAAVQSVGNARKINFCQWCGGTTKHDIPDGEEKMRAICTVCGRITYQNPKMVVGCLIEHDKKILLCKRNIEPSHGLWTLPAGYMEVGESASEGAIRETWEEAGADVEVLSPFAQLDIPLIGQTYIIFLAKLKKPHFAPGPESLECQLFALDDIPFDSLAFSSIFVTLKLYIDDIKRGKLNYHYGTITKRPGSSPSDMHAFSLDYHLQS